MTVPAIRWVDQYSRTIGIALSDPVTVEYANDVMRIAPTRWGVAQAVGEFERNRRIWARQKLEANMPGPSDYRQDFEATSRAHVKGRAYEEESEGRP